MKMVQYGTPITDELRAALAENPHDIDAIVNAIEKIEKAAYTFENSLDGLRGI